MFHSWNAKFWELALVIIHIWEKIIPVKNVRLSLQDNWNPWFVPCFGHSDFDFNETNFMVRIGAGSSSNRTSGNCYDAGRGRCSGADERKLVNIYLVWIICFHLRYDQFEDEFGTVDFTRSAGCSKRKELKCVVNNLKRWKQQNKRDIISEQDLKGIISKTTDRPDHEYFLTALSSVPYFSK